MIADIRKGLKTNLSTIRGLRVAESIPDNPNPPQAVVALSNVSYDRAFASGLVEYNFIVSLVVGRASEREAQRRLDAFISTVGTQSVKTAIESDKTLDGMVYDLRVIEMSQVGQLTIGDTVYLGADFAVTVYAN